MREGKNDLLSIADEFEHMAELAASEVLRCRYRSMARYWSILAEQIDQAAALKGGDIAQQQTLGHAA